MIVAGLSLLIVGSIDLVRQFVPRRRIGLIGVLVGIVLLGVLTGAPGEALIAVVVGAMWLWTMPDAQPGTYWPAVALAIVSVGTTVLLPRRSDGWMLGGVDIRTPIGAIPFDVAVLATGAVVFLLESGNLVVRAALDREGAWRPEGSTGGFRGGRLIGPLERVLVFLLMLVQAYPLLAALLAAKGIVRFPEISKDGETGDRAEYFLVGSLVSWVMALGAAFLVWWAVNV